MAAEVQAYTLTEQEFSEWNELVKDSPDGSPYSMPEYLDALCTAAGGSFRILGARRGDQIVGGVGLYENRSGNSFFVSPRLLLYYNGIVLRRPGTSYPSIATSSMIHVQDALAEALDDPGYDVVRLQCRAPLTDLRVFGERGWKIWPGYTYVVDISDLDATWQRIEQNLKRLIKRCTRNGFVMTEDEDFEPFFRLHRLTMDRLGVSTYLPPAAFETFFRTLRRQGLCRLYHARLPNGSIAASQLVMMGTHPVTHTVCAAADPDYVKTGASAFLRWKVFEQHGTDGFRGNDLTDAGLNSITRFKSQLGGELQMFLVAESPGSRRHRAHRALHNLRAHADSVAGRLKRLVRKASS